jgi:4-amino-4-deoxy-L-arabinose transferase-like glycosyltransferase
MTLYSIQRRHIQFAILAFLVAFVVRVLFTVYYPVDSRALPNEAKGYWDMGVQMTDGRFLEPTSDGRYAFWPPGYSVFLAAIIMVFGQNGIAILTAQLMVSAASVALTYLCAVRLFGDKRALLVIVLFTFLPFHLFSSAEIMTETFYIFLYVCIISLVLLVKDNYLQRDLLWVIAGILLGLLGLTRREGVVLGVVVIAAVYYLRIGLQWKSIRVGAIGISLCVLVTSPWILRNWSHFGQPIFSTTFGDNLVSGNSPTSNGRGSGGSKLPQEWRQIFFESHLDELALDDAMTKLGTEWIRENPVNFFLLIPMKLDGTWGWADSRLGYFGDIILYLLLIPGFLRLVRKRENWQIMTILAFIPFLYVSATTSVFHGWFRYKLIAYPGFILLAAYGMPPIIIRSVEQSQNWITNKITISLGRNSSS